MRTINLLPVSNVTSTNSLDSPVFVRVKEDNPSVRVEVTGNDTVPVNESSIIGGAAIAAGLHIISPKF